MTGKVVKDVTASVLAKLRSISTSSGAPFQQMLQLYAIERFLYRISKSKHAQSVILKGALLLKTIGIPNARPTVDIDMLRKGKADHASLIALVRDCATVEVEADGLTFIADSVVAEDIAKDSEYKGTRILMDARMDNVRLKIQIDFGVGDVMMPGPRMIEFPVLLAGNTIHLLAYPIESSIAEKLQAIVALGNANSRMKDFYDVWLCSKYLDFNADSLLEAIDATFNNRETPMPTEDVDAFTASFVEGHRAQWNAFVRKMGEKELVDALGRIVEDIKTFAMPALRSLAGHEKLARQWKAGHGWVAVQQLAREREDEAAPRR
jgi:predicted nucleotidyltransferase component of viral defense system